MVRAAAFALAAVELASGLFAGTERARAAALVDEILDVSQVTPADRRRLARGDVVAFPVDEGGERDLAVGLAVIVPAPMSRLVDTLGSGQLITRDPTVSSAGERLPLPPLAPGDRDEAEALAAAQPGRRFNLSAAEIDSLRAAARPAMAAPREAILERVWNEYRKLLTARWRAFEQGGLDAIAPYARPGGVATEPGTELRRAAADALRVARYGPALQAALLRSPGGGQQPEAVQRLYWVRRRVEGRPTMTLLHQLVLAGPAITVHVERSYYVGHSYNASQTITAVAAHPDGVLVFVTSRFSTDEVLGVGNSLKRSVGRTQVRSEMQRRLERMRDAYARPTAPATQSP